MKKYGKTGAALLAAAFLCAGGAVQAAEPFYVDKETDLSRENGWTDHGLCWAPEDVHVGNVVIIGREGSGTAPDLSGKYISGGYSSDKDVVSGNSVTMKSGTVGALYGGYGQSAESVLGNTVNFSGDTVNYVYGGQSENGSAERNTVTLSSNGKATYVYGGYGLQGTASDNTVTVSGVTVEVVVCGGYSMDGSAENTVTLASGTVKGVVYGGWSRNGSAERNTVTISGGTVTEPMYGACVYGGYSVRQNATGNSVILSGGTVNTSVYGGYSENGSATDNTVTLTGDAVVSSAQLYGSNKEVSEDNSGNNLVVDNWSGGENGTTVCGLHNFESIHFTNLAVGKDTELNIAEGGTVTGMNGVTVFIDSIGAGDCKGGETYQNTLTWDDPLKPNVTKVEIASNLKNGQPGWISTDRAEGGLYVNQISYVNVAQDDQNASQVNISATIENSALAGKYIDSAGEAVDANRPLVIGDDFYDQHGHRSRSLRLERSGCCRRTGVYYGHPGGGIYQNGLCGVQRERRGHG